MVVHPRFKFGLKPPGRGGKSDTKPTTSNPDLFVLLMVTVFNMAQYWIIINSFSFIGISLTYIKTPLYHRKSMFILKNRWGLRFGGFFTVMLNSTSMKLSFPPHPVLPAGPRGEFVKGQFCSEC